MNAGIVSTVAGTVSVALAARGIYACYPFGVIYAAAYAYVSWQNRIYGEALLGLFFYIPVNLYGFFSWRASLKKDEASGELPEGAKEIRTRALSGKIRAALLAGMATCSLLIFAILTKAGGHHALFDAIAFVCSVTAQLLEVNRYIENWVIWIANDVLLIALWTAAVSTGGISNLSMVIMWSIYLILALYGFFHWIRLSRREGNQT